jgi:exocyst complex component 1
LERFLVDADEAGNVFLLHLLEKQRMRLKGLFDRHVVSFLSLLWSSISILRCPF